MSSLYVQREALDRSFLSLLRVCVDQKKNIMLSKYRFIHSIQIKQYVIGHNSLTEVRYEDTLIDPISFQLVAIHI